MYVQANDTKLWCEEWGDGFPLICLHGGMGINSAYLKPLAHLFAHDTRCVVIYDQRGHGKSSRSNSESYTHAQWVEDLRVLALARGYKRFDILGHSYGGFIALEFALRYPEMLRRLILVGTSAGPMRLAVPDVRSADEVREFFRTRWERFFSGKNKFWDVFDKLDFSAEPFVAAFQRELRKYDVRDQVAKIQTPTLLIVGGEDHYLDDMRWLEQAMPAARLHMIPNVGHFPFLEKPKQFNQLMREVNEHTEHNG